MDALAHLQPIVVDAAEASIFARWGGNGAPLLLLHGFPETHVMWHKVVPLLTRDFMVVCADLRGYGQSSCPPSTPDHAPYAKRAMARDMVAVMEHLGCPSFFIAGHDRGGRVAYRLALDHPTVVRKVAVALERKRTCRDLVRRSRRTPRHLATLGSRRSGSSTGSGSLLSGRSSRCDGGDVAGILHR